jgi:hypothetical protein
MSRQRLAGRCLVGMEYSFVSTPNMAENNREIKQPVIVVASRLAKRPGRLQVHLETGVLLVASTVSPFYDSATRLRADFQCEPDRALVMKNPAGVVARASTVGAAAGLAARLAPIAAKYGLVADSIPDRLDAQGLQELLKRLTPLKLDYDTETQITSAAFPEVLDDPSVTVAPNVSDVPVPQVETERNGTEAPAPPEVADLTPEQNAELFLRGYTPASIRHLSRDTKLAILKNTSVADAAGEETKDPDPECAGAKSSEQPRFEQVHYKPEPPPPEAKPSTDSSVFITMDNGTRYYVGEKRKEEDASEDKFSAAVDREKLYDALAAMSPAEFGRVRDVEAAKLGIKPMDLRAEVTRRRRLKEEASDAEAEAHKKDAAGLAQLPHWRSSPGRMRLPLMCCWTRFRTCSAGTSFCRSMRPMRLRFGCSMIGPSMQATSRHQTLREDYTPNLALLVDEPIRVGR